VYEPTINEALRRSLGSLRDNPLRESVSADVRRKTVFFDGRRWFSKDNASTDRGDLLELPHEPRFFNDWQRMIAAVTPSIKPRDND
jgi:hypothetical protein